MSQNILKKKKERVILHIDGDAFFVGCEVAKNPKLRGLPVVTGEERGIVSALSYEAKALGITRGMPIFKVKKDFPNVLILAGDYASYVEYSEKMFEIVRRYADDVEEYSIDECFADLTGFDQCFKMRYFEIAKRIKDEVNKELGLSVSVGIAPTKVLAKVASSYVKPNGLTEIKIKDAPDFLSHKPVEKIWGIGPRTAEFLKKRGIHTAQEFVDKDISWIRKNLSLPYESIWLELRGIEVYKINADAKTEYSSIQKTRTFHPPTNDSAFLLSQISKHIEEACRKARHYDLVPQKISFFLKTQKFKYYAHTIKLATPTNAPEVLMSLIEKNFDKVYLSKALFRTAGITLQNLVKAGGIQNDLFGDALSSKKIEDIHKHIDKLEDKWGKRLVHLASSHHAYTIKTKGTDADSTDHDLLFL